MLAALEEAAASCGGSLQAVVAHCLEAFASGLPFSHALRVVRGRLAPTDRLRWVLDLLILAEERGLAPGLLAQRLDRACASISALEQLRSEARASTAATRSSQLLVSLIVPFVLVVTLVQSPEIGATLLHTPAGRAALLAAALLEAAAVVLGRHVVRVPGA